MAEVWNILGANYETKEDKPAVISKIEWRDYK